MTLKRRVHLAGGTYHVVLRGNGGQGIFPQDEDRCHLYLLPQEGVERFGHYVYAFCLMTNHLHLAVQVADEAQGQACTMRPRASPFTLQGDNTLKYMEKPKSELR